MEPVALRLRDLPLAILLVATLFALGCTSARAPATAVADDAGAAIAGEADAAPPPLAEEARGEPDGNDDPEEPGEGKAPDGARFEKVGTPPLALTRICDLTPFDGALYMAHANQPLGTDGATITRYRPASSSSADAGPAMSVAFDWNRPGEPTKGGGAGQGFLRIRSIGGRLFVPDSDPPYGGLGLVDHGTEGYVFRSDEHGAFARARSPHFRPPATAGVLPRAYHVIDVIRFHGALYASTGSVPPTEHAWRGASPGALHRANDDLSRWTYETDYPFPWNDRVTRLTFLVRFADRLYAGIQDFDSLDPNDYVYFTPQPGEPIRHEDAHTGRATKTGSAQTLRWWVDTRSRPHRLY